MVIGTVKGDLHDIGKNLVSMMMEGAGFEVIDLGVDVDSEAFVKRQRRKTPTYRSVGPADHDHADDGKHGQGGKEAGMATRKIMGGAR